MAPFDRLFSKPFYIQLKNFENVFNKCNLAIWIFSGTEAHFHSVMFYRAVLRCDEDLTRGDMEARYKEISWLMSLRNPFIVLAWQTGMTHVAYLHYD